METQMRQKVLSLTDTLLQHGLLTEQALAEGDVMVAVSKSRHQLFSVLCRRSDSYFVKRAEAVEMDAFETLGREALLYQMIATEPELAPLAAFIPRFVKYDRDSNIFILGYLDKAINLQRYALTRAGMIEPVISRVGTAVATIHRSKPRHRKDPASGKPLFPCKPQWMLQAHATMSPNHQMLTTGNRQLLDILRGPMGLAAELDRLHREWKTDTFLHTDLKLENCLICETPETSAPPRLYLIDWEMADYGDAAWDVASIFQSLLLLWIESIPSQPGQSLEEVSAQAKVPIGHAQTAIRAFWSSYVDAMELKPTPRDRALHRATRFLGARLVQRAYERMARHNNIDAHSFLILQVAANVMKNTESAIVELLGIGGSND